MKRVVLGVAIASLLAGCGSDVDIVKGGVMDFNQTTTLGKVLDNWKSCQNSKWDAFETENGIRVVEFSCTHEIAPFIKKIKSLSSEKDRNSKGLDIVSNTQTFQFTLNQDDSFQIDNVQVTNVWGDGTSFTDSQKPIESLETAYSNDLNFDPATLNKTSAAQMAYMLNIIKARAN